PGHELKRPLVHALPECPEEGVLLVERHLRVVEVAQPAEGRRRQERCSVAPVRLRVRRATEGFVAQRGEVRHAPGDEPGLHRWGSQESVDDPAEVAERESGHSGTSRWRHQDGPGFGSGEREHAGRPPGPSAVMTPPSRCTHPRYGSGRNYATSLVGRW